MRAEGMQHEDKVSLHLRPRLCRGMGQTRCKGKDESLALDTKTKGHNHPLW